MKWILHSDVVGLYLSGKDSNSNPFKMTQVYLSLSLSLSLYIMPLPGRFEPNPTYWNQVNGHTFLKCTLLKLMHIIWSVSKLNF